MVDIFITVVSDFSGGRRQSAADREYMTMDKDNLNYLAFKPKKC